MFTMTVLDVTPYVNYTLTGTTTFPFTFKVISESDLVATHTDPDDVITVLTKDVDYTVSLNPDKTGDLILSDPTLLGSIALTRSLSVTQEVDWVNNDPLDMVVQENSFDKLTMILQDYLTMTLSFPDGFPPNIVFPLPEASSLIGWDATGTNLTNYTGYGDLSAAIIAVEASLASALAAEAQALVWAQEAANCFAATEDIYVKNLPVADLTGEGMVAERTVDANATGVSAALYVATDGNLEEADASSISTMPCAALALETGTGTLQVLRQGYIRNDAWSWTPGGIIYVSITTGALTQTPPSGSGEIVQNVGIAEASNIIYFSPSFDIAEVL